MEVFWPRRPSSVYSNQVFSQVLPWRQQMQKCDKVPHICRAKAETWRKHDKSSRDAEVALCKLALGSEWNVFVSRCLACAGYILPTPTNHSGPNTLTNGCVHTQLLAFVFLRASTKFFHRSLCPSCTRLVQNTSLQPAPPPSHTHTSVGFSQVNLQQQQRR